MREKKQINIEIGEQVRVARERAKLTQEQLAERIEVSPQFISDLERGVVGVSIPTLKALCITLRVSSDALLFGAETNSQLSALTNLCQELSHEHLRILTDIAEKYIEAISVK